MTLKFNNGVWLNLDGVAHAWIIDQPITVHLYWASGLDAEFRGPMAQRIWDKLTEDPDWNLNAD